MKCEFTLKNKTNWDTRDLKKLVRATIKFAGTEHKHHDIICVNQTWRWNNFTHSYAYIGGRTIVMKIPKKFIKNTKEVIINAEGQKVFYPEEQPFDSRGFADTLLHEINHNLGLRHKEMMDAWDVSWTDKFPVSKKQPKQKVKHNLKQERYEKAKKLLEGKERQLKRLQNQIKKWKQKIKYYEKKIKKDNACSELTGSHEAPHPAFGGTSKSSLAMSAMPRQA